MTTLVEIIMVLLAVYLGLMILATMIGPLIFLGVLGLYVYHWLKD